MITDVYISKTRIMKRIAPLLLVLLTICACTTKKVFSMPNGDQLKCRYQSDGMPVRITQTSPQGEVRLDIRHKLSSKGDEYVFYSSNQVLIGETTILNGVTKHWYKDMHAGESWDSDHHAIKWSYDSGKPILMVSNSFVNGIKIERMIGPGGIVVK